MKHKNHKKKSAKKDNNNSMIRTPSFKMTPSGIIPSGWTQDLRNRLVEHYKEYDYQFMKLEVTDDNEELDKIFNCGKVMQEVLKSSLL